MRPLEAEAVEPRPADPGWSPRTFFGAALCVLAARALYLWRYGWDLGWMNLSYLERARVIALGRRQVVEEQPLAYYALALARRLGLAALAANEAVYLVAHLLMALGALGIARFVWPAASARRRTTLVATLALVPLLSSQSGRNNLGVSLAAGLAAAALGLAASAAVATPSGRLRASTAAALIGAALLAALASTGRYEALLTCGGGALALGLLGGRMPTVPGYRRAALSLAVGALGGLAAVIVLRRALAGGASAGDSTYAFYTFYDGLPILMFPHLPSTEYARYRASVGFFGGFDENHGSLLRALLHHPGFALLRLLTKPVDLLAVLLWAYGLTPVGVALAVGGLRGIARQRLEWQRGWLLAAYLLPLAMLFVPQQNPAYYVSVAVPLVLAVARGADRLGAWLAPAKARTLAGAAVLAALVLIGAAGKLTVTNSRALNQAAPYLEARCRGGCLTNALPQALGDQAWVVTDAGAPFPPREHRTEQVILGDRHARQAELYDYCARVRRSRAGGFTGPVLYIDARIRSFTAFDPDFDPEIRYQGTLDRSDLVEERRFSNGPDEVVVYRLPDDRPCLRAR